MDVGTLVLIGLAMAVGLVGVVIPVIPGLLLVAVAGLGWAILAEGAGPWVVFGFMAVVLAVGTVAKYVLPSRTLRQAGAPASTLVLGALGGIVGFFVIPVIGLLVGAVAGIYLGELRRLYQLSSRGPLHAGHPESDRHRSADRAPGRCHCRRDLVRVGAVRSGLIPAAQRRPGPPSVLLGAPAGDHRGG
ncbi:MAG: DUF456 domain-containing protein [Geodermatophilaceae bacterium]